jgi:transposase
MADLAGCSLRTVYYLLSYDQDYGTTTNPFTRTFGRPRSLDIGDLNYLTSLIAARPKIYLDELQEDLVSARGIDVSVATISRALRRWEMSNKSVASAALERNELLRATWQAEHGDIPAEYCVWIDEASVDDKTNQRERGWSPIGQACVCRETFIRGQRFSVLPVLTSEGIIALDIFEGSVNKERFILFIKEQVVCTY